MEVRQPMDITTEQLQNQTWQISEAELTTWRTLFDEPDEAELSGLFLPDQPGEYTSWSAWAAKRWPSLPDEYA